MRIISGNNTLERLEMYIFTISFDKFYGKIRHKLFHIYSNGTCTSNCTNHDPWKYLWLVLTLFLISNFLISVFIYSVRWILTCNSLNKTNTTKLFLLKNVFKKLQEICPKKHIFEQSIIFAWHPTTRNNCGHWMIWDGKMGIIILQHHFFPTKKQEVQ